MYKLDVLYNYKATPGLTTLYKRNNVYSLYSPRTSIGLYYKTTTMYMKSTYFLE